MPWAYEPSLLPPRFALAAATCDAPSPGSGYRIYAIGGITASGTFAPAAAYDTLAKKWSPIAQMNTPRSYLGAASGSDGLHAMGGNTNSGAIGTTVADHEIYNPATDAWSPAAPLPAARWGLAAVTGHDGLIYALGSIEAVSSPPGVNFVATVDAYDPATGIWSPKAPMPTARIVLAAVTGPDGLIYAIGGNPGNPAEAVTSVDIFDPTIGTKGSWTPGPPLPSPVSALAAAVGPDGLIYAIGGHFFNASGTDRLQTAVYSYDPATPATGWVSQAPLQTARSFLAAATGPDGLIYAIGGEGGSPTEPILGTVEALAVPLTAPDPYVGNGTIQSPFIVFFDSNGTPVPLEPTGVSWQPSKQYGVQAIIYNDSTVAAPNTTVGFWRFINVPEGKPPDATLIDQVNVTVPANGLVVVNSPTGVSYQGLQGARVAVTVANPESPYFNVDPTKATEVISQTVERPPGSGHYGVAWRGYPDSCLDIQAQLNDINPGDFNTLQEYKAAVAGLRAELDQCLRQWGGP